MSALLASIQGSLRAANSVKSYIFKKANNAFVSQESRGGRAVLLIINQAQ